MVVGAILGNSIVVITVFEKLFLNKRAFSNFFEKSKEFFSRLITYLDYIDFAKSRGEYPLEVHFKCNSVLVPTRLSDRSKVRTAACFQDMAIRVS